MKPELELKEPARPVRWGRFILLGVGIGLLIMCMMVSARHREAETGEIEGTAPTVHTLHVHHYDAGLSQDERTRVEDEAWLDKMFGP